MHDSQAVTELYCTACAGTQKHKLTLNQTWRCLFCGVEKPVTKSVRIVLSQDEQHRGRKIE